MKMDDKRRPVNKNGTKKPFVTKTSDKQTSETTHCDWAIHPHIFPQAMTLFATTRSLSLTSH